ncbi:TPA: hypothetical protein I8Y83_002706 [Legionella pneumophila]|uniref:hypothetical protein n=1 Tax=Legionella bozemanae TaxID=447 RepID=UPI00104102AC|nr:hypothetical protein [Legionella bozemanae]HAT1722158.1 hypothetical protein [Legionella pneumophila]
MMILLRLQCGEKRGRGYLVDAVYTDAVSAAMPLLIALTLQLVDIIILGTLSYKASVNSQSSKVFMNLL